MKNGLVKKYYSNGKLYIECNYTIDLQANQLNAKRNGLHKQYYDKNGKLCVECNFINVKRTGLYKEYWNGQLEYLSYDINNVEYYLKYFYKTGFTIMI